MRDLFRGWLVGPARIRILGHPFRARAIGNSRGEVGIRTGAAHVGRTLRSLSIPALGSTRESTSLSMPETMVPSRGTFAPKQHCGQGKG